MRRLEQSENWTIDMNARYRNTHHDIDGPEGSRKVMLDAMRIQSLRQSGKHLRMIFYKRTYASTK
jgi:hypothetical protein